MSEGNPVAQESGFAQKFRSKTALIAAGTAVAVVVTGIILQWVRADSSDAAERSGTAQTGQPGGSGKAVTVAAKVSSNGRSIRIPLQMVADECVKRIGNDVLDSMINRAIIQLACEHRDITVTENEVDREIMRIAAQFKIPVQTWLEMLQVERNINPQQYRRDVIWPMLALKKLAGDSVKVTEEDKHKAFIRNYGPRVKVRMIMLDDLKRANEVWQKAKINPKDFERLARDYSIDPNSRSLGGSVPPIARYSGSPELEKAAFNLREGETSTIINIGFDRFVILKCEGFTEQVVEDIKQVEDRLHEDLVEEKVQEAVAILFEDLKKSTRIDNYFKGTVTGDIQQTSGASRRTGSGVRQATGTQRQATGRAPVRSTTPSGTQRTNRTGTQRRSN